MLMHDVLLDYIHLLHFCCIKIYVGLLFPCTIVIISPVLVILSRDLDSSGVMLIRIGVIRKYCAPPFKYALCCFAGGTVEGGIQ